VTRLYLIRHAAVEVRRDRGPEHWHLSAEGRAAVDRLAEEPYWANVRGLHSSPEPKAFATAQRIAARHGLRVRIESDLREVEGRTWVAEDYEAQVRRYFAGEAVATWEPLLTALGRISSCIDGIATRHEGLEVGVVSHGLVLTLYVSDLLGLDGAGTFELWSRMRLPDVAVVDAAARRVERGFGQE
jgi:broad specificity phosphatase PhoE